MTTITIEIDADLTPEELEEFTQILQRYANRLAKKYQCKQQEGESRISQRHARDGSFEAWDALVNQ